MKRWIALALAACLLLAGCGADIREEAEKGPVVQVIEPVEIIKEPEMWREVYKAFLAELCKADAAVRNIDRPDYNPNDYPGEIWDLERNYFLYDIDWDGVPELLLRSGFYQNDIRVYTVQDGKIVELAEHDPLEGRYIQFYTCPEEPGLMVEEAVKGYFYVYQVTLSDGELCKGEDLYETDTEQETWDGADHAYPGMAAFVPGSTYIRDARVVLGLTWGEEFDSDVDQPLTLPIDDYGKERKRAELDLDRDAAARAAIQTVLDGEAMLTGVAADKFGGDTGPMTLENYLMHGNLDGHKTLEQIRLTWVDVDQDGRRECVLRQLPNENGITHTVILSEQAGTVYAYRLNYSGDDLLNTDGVFCDTFVLENGAGGAAYALSFDKNQCYQYTVPYDATVPAVEWENA